MQRLIFEEEMVPSAGFTVTERAAPDGGKKCCSQHASLP